MIEIKYKNLSNMNFQQAVSNLMNEKLPARTAYQLKKMADALNKGINAMKSEYMAEVLAVTANKNEKGEIVFEEGQPVISEAKKDDHKKLTEEFGERVAKIDRLPIAIDMLSGVSLSASDISNLDPILSELHQVDCA